MSQYKGMVNYTLVINSLTIISVRMTGTSLTCRSSQDNIKLRFLAF